jgi:hypothetical protein
VNGPIDYDKLPADVLNMLEQYRRTLNQMRVLDARAPQYEDFARRSRRLASGLELRGVHTNALLHDRHWAQVVVPGSTVEP